MPAPCRLSRKRVRSRMENPQDHYMTFRTEVCQLISLASVSCQKAIGGLVQQARMLGMNGRQNVLAVADDPGSDSLQLAVATRLTTMEWYSKQLQSSWIPEALRLMESAKQNLSADIRELLNGSDVLKKIRELLPISEAAMGTEPAVIACEPSLPAPVASTEVDLSCVGDSMPLPDVEMEEARTAESMDWQAQD